MTFLPVVNRELRVSARRGKTYGLRVAAAAAALVVSVWVCLWAARTQNPVMVGKWLFTYLSILAFGYCLLVGPFLTADSISEEKRDGTLGLMFLTELGSLDVVLGKWLATSLAGFYGLLAILPALGLPLLMGGVTPDEYGRMSLAIINAMLFSLTAGMFVSTLSRDQSKAILGSVILILGLAGLIPGLATVVGSGFLTKPAAGAPPLALLSPAYTGYLATDAAFKAGPRVFWTSLALVHGLSWLFLLGTAVLVPRVWREDPEARRSLPRWLVRFGYTPGWRATFQRRLETNPVFAVAARLRWPHLVFWSLVLLVAINVYWLTYGYRRNVGAYQFHQYFSHALVFTNRVWLSVMACRFLLEARRTGAIELLLTTPLQVPTLLRGHWRALTRLFVGPVFVIALLHVLYVEESWRLSAASMGSSNVLLLRSYLGAAASSLINFLTDIVAICCVGTWLSVASRKPAFAVLQTFGLVILLPWTVGYFLPNLSSILPTTWTTYLMTQSPFRLFFGGSLVPFPLFRTVVWVTKNVLFILWARHGLQQHFRAAAAQTYEGRGWARWRRNRSQPRRPTLPRLMPAGDIAR